ncbi:MAG: imelysin family protein [Persicimonas sp.]
MLVLAGGLASCSDDLTPQDGGEDTEAAEARRAVLAHLGEEVILPTYEDFEARAEALSEAAEDYSNSLSDDDREAVQQAWAEAIDVWQRAEMFQVGPAAAMGTSPGAEDLRDQIYSWPIVNPCRVDQEIVRENFADPQAFADEPVNVRGLDAMEYLLFFEGTDNACAPNSTINTDGSWDALDEAELQSRRAEYAHAVALDLQNRATELREAWDPEGGDFLSELATAGDGSTTFSTSQEALNAVSNAMFYLDKETKDMKLAQPAGLVDCVEDVCPEERESRFADRSLTHVRNNLAGFAQLYHGGEADDEEALGFDDLIRGLGATDLADDMSGRIADAIDTADAVDSTMAEALASNPQDIVDVYDGVKNVTDLYKSQFFDVLDLEVPQRGEGDND